MWYVLWESSSTSLSADHANPYMDTKLLRDTIEIEIKERREMNEYVLSMIIVC